MRIVALAGLLLLAACGGQQTLKPAPGKAPPPKPASAPVAPTTVQMMTPPAFLRPGRSDELITRSEPRPDDPFDLPPR
jgi:hypothetical protein